MKAISLLIICGLALTSPVWAEIIVLKDGTRIEGEIRRSGEGYIVKDANGTITNVPAEKVGEIQVRPAGGVDAAMARLQSLRRASDNMTNIRQILDRYHTFIEQNAGTPAGIAADADLKVWQDRMDQGLVKVGDKWLSTQERDSLRGKSTEIAMQLHDMFKQGRLKEAGAILDHALQIDPQNVSLLYLRGVMAYQFEQLPPARKAFEATLSGDPDHAPTLNNLGVVLWRQNAHPIAMGYYDRAMLAAPGSVEILDNVAEVLNAVPKEQRDSIPVKKLVRHFKEQDEALQKKMVEKGWYRWGSTWVNEKDFKAYQEAEKAVNAELVQMKVDFVTVERRINELDRQIADTVNQMNLLDAQTYGTSPSGQATRLPYTPAYFGLSRQLAALKAERASRMDDLDKLRQGAKAVQQKMPTPKFRGIQKLIEFDGMPLPAGIVQPQPTPLPLPPANLPPTTQAGPRIGG